MRPPVLAVIGNLLWSRSGKVWAIWRVPEVPYAWLSLRRKHAEHSRVRSMLAALPSESMILSVAARIDPGEVADAMMAGVDLESHPGWVDIVEATLDRVEAGEMYRRRHYLCAQLPVRRGRGRWADWWRAISAPVLAGASLASPPIPVATVKAAARAADELEARLRVLALERPTAGEVRWLYARAARRGHVNEPVLAGWHEPRLRMLPRQGDPAIASPSLVGMLEGVNFRNGGAGTDADRPWHRRYLRIEVPEGEVSYQSFALVADAPATFWFPGGVSEWLNVADRLPFPVDWACRIRAVPYESAMRSATRQGRELASQVAQYDAEPAGPPPSLAAAMDAVDDERAELAAHPSEPELQVGMIYAFWADSLAELERRAGALETLYRGAEYHLARPTGGQLDLFEAMLPGSATPRVSRDYRQHLLCRDLAAGMPFAGVALGDSSGVLLGESRDTGTRRPVLIDPAAGENDRDGSIAAFGTLGSGKSYLAKRLAATVLLRGGRMMLIDRTQAGEYVRFAHAIHRAGVPSQVLTVDDQGSLLLDPLRVFNGPAAAQAAVGYLSLVCGVDPTSLEAATLARAVRRVHEQRGRLTDVLDALDALDDEGDEWRHAKELAVRLGAVRENRFGAAAWGEGASLDASVPCTVIHLPNLAVPARDVLMSEHLSRRLQPEQVASLGLLYLVTALARATAYADPARFAALCMDEAWALTSTLPGQQLVLDMVRDGRKHNAAVWVMSQHPEDLPRDLRDLISTRFLFGLVGGAAESGLEWLGVERDRQHLDVLERWAARRSTHDLADPPMCLLRDGAGRVGCIEVGEAEIVELREGFESNPTRIKLTHEADHESVAPGPSSLPGPTGVALPAGPERRPNDVPPTAASRGARTERSPRGRRRR